MFKSLYENIGDKIKRLAVGSFIVEAIGAVVSGIGMIFSGENFIIYGILTIVLGPIVAWVASWILYAFGELVEKVCDMQKSAERIEYLLEKESNGAIKENNVVRASTYVPEKPKSENDPRHKWLCSNCKKMRSENPCEHCGM